MIHLLDTDTVIFMIRGLKSRANPNELQRERHRLARRIFVRAQKQFAEGHRVVLSSITLAELEFGAQNSGHYGEEMDAVRRAITPFELLAFDAGECAAQYGLIRHFLESSGKPIGSLDTFIAAHALALGATLVSNNTGEYSRVPGLKFENWAK